MYKLGDIVVNRETIKKRVSELAKQINTDYAGKEVVLIGVLKGAMVFLADLMRELEMPVVVDFIVVSSYGIETETSGVVLVLRDVNTDIEGKHVIIVEDLVDTGVTLKYLRELFQSRNPASLKLCTIFDKPSRRTADLKVEYLGISVEDYFIVGYGLDYANKYRNCPDLRMVVQIED